MKEDPAVKQAAREQADRNPADRNPADRNPANKNRTANNPAANNPAREELLTASMGRLFVKMAVPGMVGMTVIGLYNLVDSIFVGQFVGPEAVSAVTMGYAVVLVNQALLTLFATGAMSLFSRAMGAKDRKTMDSMFGNVFWPVGIISLVLSVVVHVSARDILELFGASGEILRLGTEYLRVLSWGLVFGGLGPSLNFLIRAEGQMPNAMKIIIAGTLVNIVLDPVFIQLFGLGMSGAAIATIIGQFLVLAGDLLHFKSGKSAVKLTAASFRMNWRLIPDILKIGVSGMAMSIAVAVQLSILLALSSGYGDSSNIVMSASFRVMSFFYIPMFGIAYGLQPVIGANYGAGLYGRVREAWFYFFKIAAAVSALLWLFFQLCPSFVLSWFITDASIVGGGRTWFRIFESSFILYGFISVTIMLLMALGRAAKSAVVTLGRQFLFFIPLVFTLPHFLGETGLWLSYPLADLLVVILGLFLVAAEMRRMKAAPPAKASGNFQ